MIFLSQILLLQNIIQVNRRRLWCNYIFESTIYTILKINSTTFDSSWASFSLCKYALWINFFQLAILYLLHDSISDYRSSNSKTAVSWMRQITMFQIGWHIQVFIKSVWLCYTKSLFPILKHLLLESGFVDFIVFWKLVQVRDFTVCQFVWCMENRTSLEKWFASI